ncbi:DNA repair protein REV1-like [Watersipora subatra]|uniref:DNA repair protein REV1-like n=1 Tax=Watersipora subatra TaxID=2589382 RepID=UPI00355BD072
MSGRGRFWETDRETKSRRKREQEEWAIHGGYQQAKIQKLIDKYASEKDLEESDSCHKSKIFAGVSVFVNGYTEPSFDVLRQHLLENAGRYEHYYSLSRVTHVVATSLALSKQNFYHNKKVVLPSWITDSVQKGELLPCNKYLLLPDNTITKYFTDPSHSEVRCADDQDSSPASVYQEHPEGWGRDVMEPSAITALDTRPVPKPKMSVISGPAMVPADQPEFVGEFYGNSRLHHLSHWKTQLKDLVNDIRSDPNHQLTGRQRLLKRHNLRNMDSTHLEKITPEEKVYMHLDMDCFFASVALKSHPELAGSPVVVAHFKGNATDAHSLGSMSQIASCNYPARQAGVRNGMMMGKALSLCPQLKALPYDFEGYSHVSTLLYKTVASYTTEIEAVSCDELYIDITFLMKIMSCDQFAKELRDEVKERTGCPCSAGSGANLLLARLATRRAKPDGQFYITDDQVEGFISGQLVQDLPGVGRATNKTLQGIGIHTCADLQRLSLSYLQKELGVRNGGNLYQLCRGKDSRVLKPDQPRQSVSCDVNYGIRLKEQSQVHTLLDNISKEVARKLDNAGLAGGQVTLRVKVRSPDASVESAKFMGHGICDNLSKSSSLGSVTSSAARISIVCSTIWKGWHVMPSDLRGVGIQITKLKASQRTKNFQPTVHSYLSSATKSSSSGCRDGANITQACTVPTVVPQVPSLCDRAELSDVKSLLGDWFKSQPKAPLTKDKVYVNDYLEKLVRSHHVDTALAIFLFIDRFCQNCYNPEWQRFADELKLLLKSEVWKEYHAHIELS